MSGSARAGAPTHPGPKTIQHFFNSIPERYDFLNSLLSFGLESAWRRRFVKETLRFCGATGGSRPAAEHSLLDLGAGTGKSLAAFLEAGRFERAVGCDFAAQMLEAAPEPVKKKSDWVVGDFHKLPFSNESFDLVTGSFILRSVQERSRFFSEARRVLKSGGAAAFLELTRPSNQFFWSFVYRPYLRFYVPMIGKAFSKERAAYRFLSESIQSFVEPEILVQEFAAAGFVQCSALPLSFGCATIFLGEKHD